MIKSGIYKITNKVNGKVYVGQSVDIFKRWYEHRYKASCKKDISYNSALHAAFRKYGLESFSFEVIEECEKERLNEREKYWIATLKALVPHGYNILTGGQSDRTANNDILEAYASIRMKHRKNLCKECGKPIHRNSVYCKKCRNRLQTKDLDFDEFSKLVFLLGSFGAAVKKLNRSFAGTSRKLKKLGLPYHTKDVKEYYMKKNGITPSKKKVHKRVEEYFKPVQQFTKDGKIVAEFKSVRSAASSIGKNSGGLVMHLKGRLKSFAGYIWKYRQP